MEIELEEHKTDSVDPIAAHLAAQASDITPEELAQLGIDVLQECRSVLMLRFRYLDAALWRMPVVADKEIYCFITDGRKLRIGPMATAIRYRNTPDEVIRDLLHVMLHCIFRHPFDERPDNISIFSLVCDIIVEALALEMCGKQFASAFDNRRRSTLHELRKHCPTLAPNKLYRYFYDNVDDDGINELTRLFMRDSHVEWACASNGQPSLDENNRRDDKSDEDDMPEIKMESTTNEGSGSGEPNEPNPDQNADDQKPGENDVPLPSDDSSEDDSDETPDEAGLAAELDGEVESIDPDELDTAQHSQDEDSLEEAERAWEEIAKQIEVDLETRCKIWGKDASGLAQTLAVANRERYDYADFLRKFASMGEDLRINDDEFDYIYYTYGIDIYGNMPLVEPLEYKEDNRTRDFCIAIDTSGSCSGELVRTFVQRTYDILKNTESFGDEVNIHIIQCDARIQSDVKITSLRDLDEYLQDFTVHGFGGTDFRPVFQYVDKLIENEEFDNMRGLIYFTDGQGTYPERRPDYDAAFVFVNDELATVCIPPWAMKVILDEESFKEL